MSAPSIETSVIVVRARDRQPLDWISWQVTRQPQIFKSPSNWDYEWRVYLSRDEWMSVVTRVAADVDYDNFKNQCSASSNRTASGNPLEEAAYGTWHAIREAWPMKKSVAYELWHEMCDNAAQPAIDPKTHKPVKKTGPGLQLVSRGMKKRTKQKTKKHKIVRVK